MALIAAQRRNTKLLLFLLMFRSSPLRADAPQVSIGVLSGQKGIFVSSSQPFLIRESPQAKVLAEAPAESVWQLTVGESEKKLAVAVSDSAGRLIVTAQSVSIVAASDAVIRLWSEADLKRKGKGKAYRGALAVRVRGRALQVVNALNLEDYLLGVVPSEMSPSSPLEALKAQAIAARSKALANLSRHKADGFNLCATEHCQAYGGADFEKDATTQAVRDTRGVVLTYKGKIVDAVYSTTCGGMTANSEDVWLKSPVPYLRSVADGGLAQIINALFPLPLSQLELFFKSPVEACCKPTDEAALRAKNFRWTREIPFADVERWAQAKKKIGKLTSVVVRERALNGRIKRLEINGEDGSLVLVGDWDIRQFFHNLPSSAFIVETLQDVNGKLTRLKLYGAGWGHGVGLCQEGAVNLARNGWTAEAILRHYFTDVETQAIF